MKIKKVEVNPSFALFADLNIGDVFEYGDNIYVKTSLSRSSNNAQIIGKQLIPNCFNVSVVVNKVQVLMYSIFPDETA